MAAGKVYRAIGLMSGTSLDGEIDVALIETDGRSYVKPLGFYAHEYDPVHKEVIRASFGKAERDEEVERLVTDLHIDAVRGSGFEAEIIGFHGQTVYHAPADGITVQLGDGARMAKELGVTVVNDFRSADVRAGGQGAPLAPLYHMARLAEHENPAVILNLGGVANVTFVDGDKVLAFDCGPANALMDDFVQQRTGAAYDEGGALAKAGRADMALVARWMERGFFDAPAPKSLDRDEFADVLSALEGVSSEDGLASLMAFTVEGVKKALTYTGTDARWYACGGGAHNDALMEALGTVLPGGVERVEALCWNGDALEAECFAYLAVRSVLGLPISLPETTGVDQPCTGGVLHSR